MFRKGKAYLDLVASGSILSLKIASIFLAATLVVGTVTATHSDDEIKVPGLWAAAKDFWNFLSASDETVVRQVSDKDAQDKDKQLVEIISDELSTSDGAEDLGLIELTNNPVCKAIYVADYLPTYNQQTIQKCQKLIEHEEYKTLFKHYVVALCQQTIDSKLTKAQITQIQLRLRKYSQTFPQADFQVELKDIDGIYGSKTCEHIAFFQIASQYILVDGQPDQLLYDQLISIVPLSESEIKESLPSEQKNKKMSEIKNPQTTLPGQNLNSSTNSLQKKVFCTRYSDDPHCKTTAGNSMIVNLEINER